MDGLAGQGDAEAAAQGSRPGPLSAWTTVATLTTLYCFGSLDRQMMSLLVEPIKADLGFSDMQIGVLQGAAFALFFVFTSLPVGWMVDRFSRRLVIFWGTMCWSAAAMASGLSQNFAQMFAARAAVGAGEATLQPSAFAILADIFPPAKLALPLSIFVIGANIGSGLSLVLGGAVIDWAAQGSFKALPFLSTLAPWQIAFVLTGLPSLGLAFLVFLIPEARRSKPGPVRPADEANFSALARRYRQHARFYVGHHGAFTMCMAFFIGLLAWNPAFMSRTFAWDAGRIGMWLGLSQMGTAIIALSFHGWMVDRLFKRGMRDAHLRYFLIMAPLAGVICALAYQVADPWLMLMLFNLGLFCLMGYPGIGAAALQIATPSDMRGKASAVYLIALNLLGALSGPLIVAAITDYGYGDERAIGSAMSIFCMLAMMLCTLFVAIGMRGMPAAVAQPIAANGPSEDRAT